MKAVALTIQALALQTEQRRKKERKKKRCKMAIWATSVYKLPYGSGLQKGTVSHKNEC